MKKRKFYIVPALLIVASLLLLIGVACNNEKQLDETAKPSASSTATGKATPELSPTPEVTPGEDNTVTFPSEWGDWEPPTATTESTQAPVTGTEKATQGGTGTPAPTSTTTQVPVTSSVATATATPTQDRDNVATFLPNETVNTTATATASPKPTNTPKPTGTPIGVDEDGWVDKWY